MFAPSREGLNGCASTQTRLASGEQKPPVPASANLRRAPGVTLRLRPQLARLCSAAHAAPLRAAQNFAHTAAAAPRCSQPAALRQVPRAALRGRGRRAAGSRLLLSCLQFPPRGLPRGCGSAAPALRGAGGGSAACRVATSRGPGLASGTLTPAPPPPRRAQSETPAPGRRARHLLPSGQRGPHSSLSPLESSSGCRRGRAGSAFVPWGWQVRVGPGRAGDAAELGIPSRRRSLAAAPPAAGAAAAAAGAAAEIVRALCRPHLSYLIHHYRIPPNRGALQHFAT